jgi:hypothetical protein
MLNSLVYNPGMSDKENLPDVPNEESREQGRESYILGFEEGYEDKYKREAFLALAIKGWNYREAAEYLKENYPDWPRHPSDRTLRRWAAQHENHMLNNVVFPEAMRHNYEVLTETKTSDGLPVTVKDRTQVALAMVEQKRGKPKQRLEGEFTHHHLDYAELMDLGAKHLKENPVTPDGDWQPPDENSGD